MKKKLQIIGAVLVVGLLSSCNRGMGCPSDFSLGDWISTLINALPL